MLRKCLFLLSVVSLTSFGATDSTLTLKTVIDLAIKQGISAQQSLIQVDQKRLAVQQAQSAFLPKVNSSLSSSTGSKITSSPSFSSSADASIGVSYRFSPSSIPAYQAAKVQNKGSEYQYQQKKNEITTEAIKTYIKAIYAQKKINTAQSNLNYQKSKLQQIEEYRNAGKKSIADVLQQQTAVAESEATLLEAQQSYGKLILSLYDICSLPLTAQHTLDTTVLEPIVGKVMKSDSSVKKIEIDNNPQILSSQMSVSAAELSVKKEQMNYLPSIDGSLSGGHSWDGKENGVNDPTGRASISISYPIFDAYSRKQSVKRAGLDLQNAKLDLQKQQKDISLQHSQTVYDLEMAQKQFQVAETRLTAAKQSLDATTERYDAGASTLVEVAMVNASYLSAVNAQLQAESSILTAYFDMLKSNGQIKNFVDTIITSK